MTDDVLVLSRKGQLAELWDSTAWRVALYLAASVALGVAAGLLLTVLAALGAGGLGADRLAHLGARVGELAVFAPTLLGLAGLVSGLFVGLARRPRAD